MYGPWCPRLNSLACETTPIGSSLVDRLLGGKTEGSKLYEDLPISEFTDVISQ